MSHCFSDGYTILKRECTDVLGSVHRCSVRVFGEVGRCHPVVFSTAPDMFRMQLFRLSSQIRNFI